MKMSMLWKLTHSNIKHNFVRPIPNSVIATMDINVGLPTVDKNLLYCQLVRHSEKRNARDIGPMELALMALDVNSLIKKLIGKTMCVY